MRDILAILLAGVVVPAVYCYMRYRFMNSDL